MLPPEAGGSNSGGIHYSPAGDFYYKSNGTTENKAYVGTTAAHSLLLPLLTHGDISPHVGAWAGSNIAQALPYVTLGMAMGQYGVDNDNEAMRSAGSDLLRRSAYGMVAGMDNSGVDTAGLANWREKMGVVDSGPQLLGNGSGSGSGLLGSLLPTLPPTSAAGGAGSGGAYSPAAPRESVYTYADIAKMYGMDQETAYQEALANTAYRRMVADLQAAGLNPALATGRTGASSDIYGHLEGAGAGYGFSGRGATSAKKSSGIFKLLGAGAGLLVGKSAGAAYLGMSIGSLLDTMLV